MGGLQFLLPLFDQVGRYPAGDESAGDSGLIADLESAVEEFREAMEKALSADEQPSSVASLAPAAPISTPPAAAAAADTMPKRTDSACAMDASAKETVFNAAIELLQLASTLQTTTSPISTYNLPC